MKKLTKKQIALFAKIQVANQAQYFDSFGIEDGVVSEEDREKCVQAVRDLALKLSGGYPMNFGSTEQIIKFICNEN